MIIRSLKIANGSTDKLPALISPNNNGTEKGAISDVIITILIDSEILPLTMSVNVGDDTPAGMDVSRRTPIASFGLNKFTRKKKRRGIISI